MPFSVTSSKSGVKYYLHSRDSETGSGKRMLFFFAREVKTGSFTHALDEVPDGYCVIESDQTGLPMLKRAEA